jgi:hypothetical protein
MRSKVSHVLDQLSELICAGSFACAMADHQDTDIGGKGIELLHVSLLGMNPLKVRMRC